MERVETGKHKYGKVSRSKEKKLRGLVTRRNVKQKGKVWKHATG